MPHEGRAVSSTPVLSNSCYFCLDRVLPRSNSNAYGYSHGGARSAHAITSTYMHLDQNTSGVLSDFIIHILGTLCRHGRLNAPTSRRGTSPKVEDTIRALKTQSVKIGDSRGDAVFPDHRFLLWMLDTFIRWPKKWSEKSL